MKFLLRRTRRMMNMRYPRFTAIELGVLALSVIIAVVMQM
jgi:hypothetical protein